MNTSIRSMFVTTIYIMMTAGCGGSPQSPKVLSSTSGAVSIRGDVWADNWFALYVGEELLIEDSVSIKTERSFNSESFVFSANYPIVLNFVLKDFKEDDSGLEYIGTNRQQLGDGGFIAQFTDLKTGRLLTATDANWRCLVLHHGPVDEACASEATPVAGQGPCAFNTTQEPSDWKTETFSTDQWPLAREYSEGEVQPKDGYDRIDWDKNAKLIWSDHLKKDNTVLFRVVIEKPDP